jgi:hypothetical protein
VRPASAAIAAALVATAPAARAEEPPVLRNALSIYPLALFQSGFALQYERFAFPPRISVATSLGGRSGVSGDYRGLTLGAGLTGRFWLLGRSPWSGLEGRQMIGPFAGLQIDATTTRVKHASGRTIGAAVVFAESALLGWKIAFFRHLEITPALGLGLATEIDSSGFLPTWTRPQVHLALTAGTLL